MSQSSSSISLLLRPWRDWFTPRATDPLVTYRERGLRFLLIIITPLRVLAIIRNYSGAPDVPPPYFPWTISVATFVIPIALSFWFLARRKLDLAAFFFLLHWYLADMLSLPAEGYWYANFQISLTLQVVLAALLLPGWAIVPYLVFQVATVGVWGAWLDSRYFVTPRLANGRPIAIFWLTLITLAAQETIFMLIVRFLRLEMEKHVRRQQAMIEELQEQVAERLRAEADVRRSLEREQRLNEVTRAANSTLDLPSVLSTLVQLAAQLVGADAGTMSLVAPDGQTLYHPCLFNYPRGLGLDRPTPKGSGITWWVIDHCEPLLVGNYRDHPDALPAWKAAGIRSLIEVPVTSGDLCLGSLGVSTFDPSRQLTERDLALIESIGRQAGVAIQNARLFEAEQRRAQQLATLNEVGRAVAALADLPELMEAVYQQAQQSLPMDFFFIALFDEPTNRLSFPIIYDEGQRWEQAPEYLSEKTMTFQTIRTGKPILRNDAPGTPVSPEEWMGDPSKATISMMFAPLAVGDRIIGVISAQSYAVNAYDEDDLALLTGIARQCAIAIHNAQLFDFTRRQLEDLTLLHTSALATASDLSEAALLEEFIQLIRSALHPDTYGLALWDETAGVLRAHPASHGVPADVLAMSTPPGLGILGTVAATRQPLRLADVRADPRYVSVDPDVCSELCVPIESGGRLIGVFDVESREPDAFSAADERLLLTLAGQLATAIDRFRASEALRRLNTELEARVQERTAQLEAANRDLEAFAYSISHDLRAPLRSIEGFSRILLEDYAGVLDADGQRHLQRVSASAQRMSQLIDDLLAFARLGRQRLNTQVCDPTPLLGAVWDELKPPPGGRAVEFSLGDLPACEADPHLLRQVFTNLLDNALKYSRPRPVARIEVGWAAGAYFVRDNGVGFDMQYAPRLFGVFQRLHTVEEFEGTGVGLAIVKRIVERHGGQVWAEATPDRGATFYFTLGRSPAPLAG